MKKAKTVVQFTALVCAVVLTCTLLYFPSQALIKSVHTAKGGDAVTLTDPEISGEEIIYSNVPFSTVADAEDYFGYKLTQLPVGFLHHATNSSTPMYYKYYFICGNDVIYVSVNMDFSEFKSGYYPTKEAAEELFGQLTKLEYPWRHKATGTSTYYDYTYFYVDGLTVVYVAVMT